jgi:hypothetical protein
MRLNALVALAGTLIGIAPLTWAIRRLAARHVRTRSSKLLTAETSNTVTIEIRSGGGQQATSITTSVTFAADRLKAPISDHAGQQSADDLNRTRPRAVAQGETYPNLGADTGR